MSILHGKQQGIHANKHGKSFFFNFHRRFLPSNHRYRKNINDFFVGRVEKDVAPPYFSGEELHDVMLKYGDIVFDL